MKNSMNNKEMLNIDEHKTHYYESNWPTTTDIISKTKNYQYGWICPKCGAVMAPDQKTYVYCAPAFDIKVNF